MTEEQTTGDDWEPEWLWCRECDENECDCGYGFYEQEPDAAPECPCCGSTDVDV